VVGVESLPPFLRVEQVMELTQLGRSQVYELMRLWRTSDGRDGIPCVRFGKCLRVPTAALLALTDPQPAGADPAAGDDLSWSDDAA
jgi:hypothetical protein